MTGLITRSCPGKCGKEIPRGEVFACLQCNRTLPAELRFRIWATWWAGDWVGHSRAVSDGLQHLSSNK